MPDLTHGKENSKDGTPISRRSVLAGGAAMVAAGAKAVTSTSHNGLDAQGLGDERLMVSDIIKSQRMTAVTAYQGVTVMRVVGCE